MKKLAAIVSVTSLLLGPVACTQQPAAQTILPLEAAKLAGFANTHAAWSVESGEMLCTLAFVETGGHREGIRRPGEIREAVASLLEQVNKEQPDRFVVVWDGVSTDPDGKKMDCVISEWAEKPFTTRYRSRWVYQSGKNKDGFCLLGMPEISIFAQGNKTASVINDPALDQAFLDGLSSHEKLKGLRWNRNLRFGRSPK